MPKNKPLGWPKLMRAKRLSGGAFAYYWEAPSWAKKAGCTVAAEPLGTDYADAKRRCDDVLNPQFDAWRTRGEVLSEGARHGTFNWMVAVYKSHPKYKERPARTRKSIDAALALAAQVQLKDGRKFGELSLLSINPGTADRLFAYLKEKPGGGKRIRTALLSMQYCRRAWNIARREKPTAVPLDNPFTKMGIDYTATRTRPVTHAELDRFVKQPTPRESHRSAPPP